MSLYILFCFEWVMVPDEDLVSNSTFFREFFLFIKYIVAVALTLYLFPWANIPNSLLVLYFQMTALSPLGSCVSFCFVPVNIYIWWISGWLNMWWYSKYLSAWIRDDRVCVDILRQQVLGCLVFWHCFVTLAFCARVSCRDNWGFEMVPLDGIGGSVCLGNSTGRKWTFPFF